MTDERKNEIWAMLPEKEQIEFQKAYDVMYECESYDMGFKDALERVFGYNNLIAQAEDSESNGESKTSKNPTPTVDYAQYRLDLAKEIAVAMIGNNDGYGGIACESVAIANDIVKRLKETDHAY